MTKKLKATWYYCDICGEAFDHELYTKDGWTYSCDKCKDELPPKPRFKKCLRCGTRIEKGNFCEGCEIYTQNG